VTEEGLSIVDGPVFAGTIGVAIALVVLLVWPAPGVRARARPHVSRVIIVGLSGAVTGTLLTWLLGDVVDIFGISLTWVVRIADGAAFAAVGVALANLLRTRWWRKVVALFSVVVTLVSLALVINADFGQYRTLADATGRSYSEAAVLPDSHSAGVPLAEWRAPSGLPERGMSGHISIPATTSGFPARDAYVYLPPAAYAPHPPALPVILALSGQPGEPADLFRAGRVEQILDSIAADHHGVAPILVAADQLGSPTSNPMCVDSGLGNSETYLTVDVPAWIRTHLPVSTDTAAWTVAGFSQGGTCAIQLGAGHPELFGTIIDISGEEAPTLGSPQKTIDEGFTGDEQAYEAATPAGLLSAHAPYRNTSAFFAVGAADAKYSASMRSVSALASRAGMAVTTEVSPGTGHDWNTARFGFRQGFSAMLTRWGIT
jgi:enterochelin esterase-like enzyme